MSLPKWREHFFNRFKMLDGKKYYADHYSYANSCYERLINGANLCVIDSFGQEIICQRSNFIFIWGFFTYFKILFNYI